MGFEAGRSVSLALMAALSPKLAKSNMKDKWAKQVVCRLSEIMKDFMVGAFGNYEIRKKGQSMRESKKTKITKQTSDMILECKNRLDECLYI